MEHSDNRFISQAHGAGGSAMQKLLKELVLSRFNWANAEVGLAEFDDSAIINNTVFSTDAHTVKPLVFPGGDIGKLAVAGTINDVSVMGSTPIALASAIVLEEGLPLDLLERILESMAKTCRAANVPIVTGDTKVMEHGALDQMIVTTTGIGVRNPHLDHNLECVRHSRTYNRNWITDRGLARGDDILVSGTLGDHGITVLSAREGIGFSSKVVSDVAPLNNLIDILLRVGGITCLKDPTRGGLANTLNEWSEKNQLEIIVDEEAIPISLGVRSASEMLGVDPLEIGNEGKIVIGCIPEQTPAILEALRHHPLGRNAARIGHAVGAGHEVILKTVVGGERILLPPVGDPIPRIC